MFFVEKMFFSEAKLSTKKKKKKNQKEEKSTYQRVLYDDCMVKVCYGAKNEDADSKDASFKVLSIQYIFYRFVSMFYIILKDKHLISVTNEYSPIGNLVSCSRFFLKYH